MDSERNSQQMGGGAPCEHCGAGTASPEGEALRCHCGSLLARYTPAGLELKCRRCKRTVLVEGTFAAGATD